MLHLSLADRTFVSTESKFLYLCNHPSSIVIIVVVCIFKMIPICGIISMIVLDIRYRRPNAVLEDLKKLPNIRK